METERLDPRRRRTRDALLRGAETAFAEHGYAATTVEQIAAHAGVTVGSIYNVFGSKAGLYAAVAERALDLDREYMDRAYTPDRTPEEQLRAAAAEYLRFALDHPDHFKLLAFPAEPATAALLAERVDGQNARMADALERGMADGTFRPTLDARATATVLWASWNGIISLAWRPDALRADAEQLGRLLDVARDVIGAGLRA